MFNLNLIIMKTINILLIITLVILNYSCSNTCNIDEKCCKMYVNPSEIIARPGGLIPLHLILENNCEDTIAGSFNIELPKGMLFNDVSGTEKERKRLNRKIPFANMML